MDLSTKTVTKSNALIEASYRLSVFEQRLLLACLAQIGRDGAVTDEVMYEVSASDISEASGVSLQAAYQHLHSAAERLFSRQVSIFEAPNGGGGIEVLQTRWIQSCKYIKRRGCVRLRFSKDIIPYLTELSAQFTKYCFKEVAVLTSSHAVRLYELLVQWKSVGSREISIEWFRSTMQLEDSYPSIKDFKRWVIVPAVTQINEHTSLWVEWEQIKTGRRVSHLAFRFGLKNPQQTIPPSRSTSSDLIAGYERTYLESLRKNKNESLIMVAARLHEERRNN